MFDVVLGNLGKLGNSWDNLSMVGIDFTIKPNFFRKFPHLEFIVTCLHFGENSQKKILLKTFLSQYSTYFNGIIQPQTHLLHKKEKGRWKYLHLNSSPSTY
jgi:hypothetical protein